MVECDDFDQVSNSYLNIMHSLGVAALFMNSFALYCIAFKSTKQMGAYKWYLLVYQMISTVFDIVYMGITLPVIFFPITMGYPASWIAHWLSISTYASIVMVVLICSLLAASILNLFHYRCHLVTPTRHFLKFIDNGHMYTSVATPSIFFISCLVAVLDLLPDQIEAKKWVLQEYTCAKSVISLPQLQVFTLTKATPIIVTVVSLDILTFLMSAAWVSLSFHFIRKSGHLSLKTKHMQRRFLLYLCIQVAIPVFSMIAPILTAASIFVTSGSTRDLGNYACILVGSHGCIAALTLIMCNEPYRRFATMPLTKLCNRRRTVVQVGLQKSTHSAQPRTT